MLRLINGTGRQRRRVIFLPWHRRDIKPLYAWRGPGAPATWSCKHDVIIMKFSVRRRFFPVSRRHFLFYTWLSVYRLIYIYRRTPLHAQLTKFTRKFSVVFVLALSIIRAVGRRHIYFVRHVRRSSSHQYFKICGTVPYFSQRYQLMSAQKVTNSFEYQSGSRSTIDVYLCCLYLQY